MELFLGFILGIVASLLASFVYASLPPHRQRPLLAFLGNPRLYLRLLGDTDERKIKRLIERLFNAWQRKDLPVYLSCWAEDAARIIGTTSNVKEDKGMVGAKFSASCKRYALIEVPSVVFENISVGPRPDVAIAEVCYRFALVRAEDRLPIIEDSREVYGLRKINGEWVIASNIDHFYEIRPSSRQ